MGSSNSRSCTVFSIETRIRRKPMLYVNAEGSIEGTTLENLLHGNLADADLQSLWTELDVKQRGFLMHDEISTFVQQVLFELPLFTKMQLQAGCRAIDELVDTTAAEKGGYTQTQISQEKATLKAQLVKPLVQSFEKIESQRERDTNELVSDLVNAVRGRADVINKDIFLQNFAKNVRPAFTKHDFHLGFPTDTFFPYGRPAPKPTATPGAKADATQTSTPSSPSGTATANSAA